MLLLRMFVFLILISEGYLQKKGVNLNLLENGLEYQSGSDHNKGNLTGDLSIDLSLSALEHTTKFLSLCFVCDIVHRQRFTSAM